MAQNKENILYLKENVKNKYLKYIKILIIRYVLTHTICSMINTLDHKIISGKRVPKPKETLKVIIKIEK